MGGFFFPGEKKVRPDNYHRIINAGGVEIAGAEAGIGAAAVTGNWGELGKAVTIEASEDYKKYVGEGTGYKTLEQMFAGGVNTVIAVRVGSGGERAKLTLKDNAASTGVDVIELTAKYPGTYPLSVSVKASLSDDSVKEVFIYSGTAQLESYSIDAGTTEVDQLVEALANSSYVIAKKKTQGSGTLKDIAQTSLTGGTDPAVNTASYGEGFSVLEAESWNNLCVDTEDAAVHALMAAFIDRIYKAGAYPMATVSEKKSVALETRMTHAQAFNNEKVIYVLNGWEASDGTQMEGYLAAARITGMIAALPANDSVTHKPIIGAVSTLESMTNTQIEKALKMGCLVISTAKASKQVRVEKGINTLVTPPADMDKGWMKIRRVKTRFEMMSRVDATIDGLNGNINNDEDGRSAIIAAGQGVLNAMIGEKKLMNGAQFMEDPKNPPEGDSAWFYIAADDIDSFEIGYLTYGFRFSQPRDAE